MIGHFGSLRFWDPNCINQSIRITPFIISGRYYDRILRSYDFVDRILRLDFCTKEF